MANISFLQGNCVAPFLDAARFPQEGGFIGGRFCAPISSLPGDPLCCLPCPATEWSYADSFNTYGTVAEWLNVAGLVLLIFMLLSYFVLPAQQTRSHYLSVCLIVSVMLIAIGFTIPLGAQPEQCYNEITPNDMYSSRECAWSGAFIIAGGLTADMWIFIRALSMNLQICWDIVPGRKFFYASQALGWGIPAVLFTATMIVTGVSFRFGNACHVNHDNSMRDFWGPLMAFAAAAGILQLMTFGYCIHVYLKNLWTDQDQTSSNASGTGSGLPSYSGSERKQTARAVYQRLKKVLWLQWRGICIVSIILVDVIFFSIVFVYLDNLQSSVVSDWHRVEPWLTCLAFNPTNKNVCLPLVQGWLVNESTVVAVLLLLSLTGIQCFLFLTRPSVFPAWAEFFRTKLLNRQEFVSLDARPDIMRSNSKQGLLHRLSHIRTQPNPVFEMQHPGQPRGLHLDVDSKTLSPTQTILSSPDEVYRSPLHHPAFSSSPKELDGRSVSPASYYFRRGRMPPEYVGSITPDVAVPTRSALPLGSPSPPAVSYNAISLHRQPSDYFAQQRRGFTRHDSSSEEDVSRRAASPPLPPPPPHPTIPQARQQRLEERRPESSDRTYLPPVASFSAPKLPSRNPSVRSVTFDPRDTYSRGGGAMKAPVEVAESSDDSASFDLSKGQGADKR